LDYEWRTEIPDPKLITSAYLVRIQQQAAEGKCERCGEVAKVISCVRFHRQCGACLSTSLCSECNDCDAQLSYYYRQKRVREPAEEVLITMPKGGDDGKSPKCEKDRSCCNVF